VAIQKEQEKIRKNRKSWLEKAIIRASDEIYGQIHDWILKDIDFEKIKELTEQSVKERVWKLTHLDLYSAPRYIVPKGSGPGPSYFELRGFKGF
jgi:hypothetical protein